ncbi:MAG TPA: PAS domain S-box protein, partial [Candidatus Acetothermia bacterium]|nr:PAS domain S-box protein [Candidatus Acetothermia bacterium]
MNATTDPKQSEEAPRGNEARFRLLFEKSPDAMLLLDEDAFVDCNQAAVEMMGCACKEQLLALHPYDISPERQPDGRLSSEKASELIAKAHQQGSLLFEWVHRRMDGQDFPAEVLLTAIPLPDRQILHASLKDITERKRAEEALRESETNLRSLLENATNFVVYRVAIDPSNPYGGRVVMVSPSIKEITGTSDPYRYESWFENIHPQDLPKAMEANRRALERGESYSQQVRVYHSQKERWIWVHTASTPVFDARGNLTHFNGLIIDITEQKRAE